MSLFESARFLTSAAQVNQLPPAGLPEIAFAGRSNAGKSTTINVLTRQGRLAFASKTPGRTQLVNFFNLSRKTGEGKKAGREDIAFLVDLPGYGYAKASPQMRASWTSLVGGYIAERPSLVGVVIVMDARRPFMPADEWLIHFFPTRRTCGSSGSSTSATRSAAPSAQRFLPPRKSAPAKRDRIFSYSFFRFEKRRGGTPSGDASFVD